MLLTRRTALAASSELSQREMRSQRERKLQRRPCVVNAVAASGNGTSRRTIRKSYVFPSGAKQFDDDKVALLSYIQEENREGILAGILSRGLVDFKRHTNYGKPLLYEAVEGGHLSCVQLLLDAGLSDEKIEYYGWSSLMCAAHLGRDRELELLISAAREHLSKEELKAYLDRRAAPRGNDTAGDTALHMAVRGNFATAVLLLLTAGASATQPNAEGKTPREVAQDSVVRKLIERAEGGPSKQ